MGSVTTMPIATRKGRRAQSEADDKLATFIETLHTQGVQAKSAFHDLWWTCHAMYDDRQYTRYRGGYAVETKAPSYRQRLQENRIAPIVNVAMAKLTQSRPEATVRPSGIAMGRILKAKAAGQLLDQVDRRDRMGSTRRQAAGWACLTGNAFTRPYWDPDAGELHELEDGQRIITGAVRLQCIPPFDGFPDPAATCMRDARWFIVQHYMAAEDVESRWPKKYGAIQDASATSAGSSYDGDDAWRQDISGLTGATEGNADRLRVLEWEKAPTREYPLGRQVYVCNGVVLERVIDEETGEEELPNRRFDIAHLKYNDVPGRFWAKGLVEPVLGTQEELNRTISAVAEIRNLHVHPMWRAPAGSLRNDQIQARPDMVVFYKHQYGAPPEHMPAPELPQTLLQLADRYGRVMEEITGIHGVSQGRGETGVISGRAMDALADQDDTKLGPAATSMEELVEDNASISLWLYKHHMGVKAAISVLGANRRTEVIELYASDIDTFDVQVAAGSGAAKHPSQDQAKVLQMWNAGMMGDPADPETQARAREHMGVLGAQGLLDDDSDETLYSDEENTMLRDDAEAAMVDVGWPDDDAAHLRRHYRCYRSTAFRCASPAAQQRVRTHMAKHHYMITLKAQRQPVWAEDAGMEVPQQQPTMPGQPMPGGEEMMDEAPEQMSATGGGTPEENGALESPQGPGVNTFEEATGEY